MFNRENEKAILKRTNALLKDSANAIETFNELQASTLIAEISAVLNYHDWLYYVENNSIINDQDYDAIFSFLKKLEQQFPKLRKEDSPTQRVARGLSADFKTVQHLIPMLSLDNSYNAEDLLDFERRVKELSDQEKIDFCVEPKFDGGSIALVYENDQLVRAATRGNGTEGDEITNNAKVIRSIPLSAKFSEKGIAKIELRGEVVIEKSNFELLNIERKKQNEKLKAEGRKELELYKNPRNTASGGLRAKDSEITANRKLEAFIYQIGIALDENGNDITAQLLSSQNNNIEYLESLGFKVPNNEKLFAKNIDQVIEHCKNWEEKRQNYNYEIDGMVVKVDNLKLHDIIGSTAHHPRWAIAYKFKAQQGKAKLYKVDYQIGRTGAVTPVAKICSIDFFNKNTAFNWSETKAENVEGLQLAGVEIKNISLHNEEFMQKKEIQLYDTVLVERAGDVIPYIKGVDKTARNGKEQTIEFRKHCYCDNERLLVKEESESVWRCVNPNCEFQAEEKIIHFVSKPAMNIEGLGKDIVKRFKEERLILSISDIYQLDFEKIFSLEGWKEKSVNKLKSSIEKSKSQPLWRLLVALGIRHVGATTAKLLSKQISHLYDFKEWTEEQFLELNDIGPKVAASLVEYFKEPKNISLLSFLEEKGINLKGEYDPNKAIVETKYTGKTFLFTGSLTQFKREEAKEIVEQNGGKCVSSVSKKLDFLIVGENAGSKLKKAQMIETIKILSEKQFKQLFV